MTPEQIKQLRELAQMATQGPWKSDAAHVHGEVPVGFGHTETGIIAHVTGWHGSEHEATPNYNAMFIAAANPTTIQALLDELESQQAESTELSRRAASLEYEVQSVHESNSRLTAERDELAAKLADESKARKKAMGGEA